MTEPMLRTVEGQSRVADAISIGARSRVSVKSPVTLTLSTRSHAFQGKVSNAPPQFAPALLTRMCKTSVRLRVSAASAATPASLATVPPKPSQGPSEESSCATASQASALREAINTRAPALSSASAQIRPRPVAPPVTSAVRPWTEKSSFAAIMAPCAAPVLRETIAIRRQTPNLRSISSKPSPPSCAVDARRRAAQIDRMKVSLIQMNSINDKGANIAAARALIERAVAEEGPDWVLLPEQFDWAGGSRAEKLAAAERLPGGLAYEMARGQAIKHRIFVHAGSIMEAIDGEERYHNTTVVFNREGEEIARYRKIHLFDVMTPDGTAYRESATVKAGDQVVTYDCEGVTVGCSICYDLRFPDLFQALAEKGAEMIAMPAAFTMQTGKDHWEVLLRARAIETETYVCASAQTGSFTVGNEQRHTYGHSLVADPWGHVIAKASDGVGIVSARTDPARVKKVRAMIPVAEHKAKIARN